MADDTREVTLGTLHQDLGELKEGIRDGLGELKALIATGIRALPPPEWPAEVIRLLSETNRLNEERFTQLDLLIREQVLETHGILRALAEGQRGLSEDIRALIARIDALIKGREDGSPSR